MFIKKLLLGALLATALVPVGFCQTWTISETANVGSQNIAHVYHTVMTSGTTQTNILGTGSTPLGWNDCLTVYSRATAGTVSASIPDSITWVGYPISQSTTTAAVSYTAVAAYNNSTTGTRNVIAGPLRGLTALMTYTAGSTNSTTLEVAQTKCSNR